MIITRAEDLKQFKNITGIYVFTDKANPDRKYVGKSINLYRRIALEHKRADGGIYIHYVIKKHGLFEKFDIEIIHWWESRPDKYEALALETAAIDDYKSLKEFGGYNLCMFGSDPTGIKRTPEQNINNSKSKIGKKKPKFSKERIQHLSKIMMGASNPFYGKKHSPATRLQMSRNRRGKPVKALMQSVKQINRVTKEIIKIWPSISEAARNVGLKTPVPICMVLHGQIKSSAGFLWEYA